MIEKVAGAHRVIASKPVHVGVKLVGTVLAHDVDDSSCVAAKLREETAGDDAKLLNRAGIE